MAQIILHHYPASAVLEKYEQALVLGGLPGIR